MSIFTFGFKLSEKEKIDSWFNNISLSPDFIHKVTANISADEFFLFKSGQVFQVFAATEQIDAFEEKLFNILQKEFELPANILKNNRFRLGGSPAIEAFLKYAIGMDSAGEISQTVQEFREGFLTAREMNLTGPYFSKLYQRGLWFSEKIRIELNLQKNAITAETVVTDLAEKIFGELNNHKALIVANNFVCETFIQKLIDKNIGELHFVDLDNQNLLGLSERFRGSRIKINQLKTILPAIDLILMFDEKIEEIVQEFKFSQIMNQRNNAPLLYISYLDESPPDHSKKPNYSNIYNIYYYNKYDLEKIVDSNLLEHHKDFSAVDKLLDKEIQNFVTWVHSKEHYRFGNIIGKSQAMQKILELVARIAQTDISVIIDGESGTGKEMVAYSIHEHSSRASNPFIVVNCGAMPENLLESELFGHVRGAFTGATNNKKGLFEAANHGTIFLDEIGETSLTMQVKLLRFLQEGEIKPVGSNQILKLDVRLITATNRDLEKMVEAGSFRQDLYYRLNVIQLTIPPLRERSEDILPLAEFFIKKYAAKIHKTIFGFGEDASRILTKYDWPGNVRELENAIERALALSSGKLLTKADLPPALTNSKISRRKINQKETLNLKELEKIHIADTLEAHNWNYDLVTKMLGIGRTTLWRKMKEYDISNEAG